jgi:hypothetical protein
VLAYGTASVVSGAADMAFLPRIVEGRHLQRAHARTDGTDAAAMTLGPALGGLLVSSVGAPLAVLVDAATYIYSAVTLSRVRVVEPPQTAAPSGVGLMREVMDGIAWAYRGSGLATLAIATHGWFVGNAVVGVVLAPYALDLLGLTAFQFGVIGAVGGAGALLGAATTTRLGLWLGTGRTIIVGHVISGVAVLVMVAAGQGTAGWTSVAVLGAGQGLYGLAMGTTNSHEMSYRQLLTPDALQARTNTTLRSANRTVMVVAAPIAGIVADGWGIRPALLIAAAVFAIVSAGLAATPFRFVSAHA